MLIQLIINRLVNVAMWLCGKKRSVVCFLKASRTPTTQKQPSVNGISTHRSWVLFLGFVNAGKFELVGSPGKDQDD